MYRRNDTLDRSRARATGADLVLELARSRGVLRPRDLARYGLAREYLRRLERRGALRRVGRGLYVRADAEVSEQHTLAEVCRRVPHGIVCLLSALRFHSLTTQSPAEVWVAIGVKARRPKDDSLPLRTVRFSGQSLESGVEEHSVEGVVVRVYGPAKTVVDCFRYRNKIGIDVALEALRACWNERRCTMDELWRYARLCRMANVMRPYLESLP